MDKQQVNFRLSYDVRVKLDELADIFSLDKTEVVEQLIRMTYEKVKPLMHEIKLVDLQEIPLPKWLPFDYIQALADVIEQTGFAPPIIILEEELLTPDVVAALVTLKDRGASVPKGVALRDGRWLVSVDKRKSKVVVEKERVVVHEHDWIPYVRSPYVWYSASYGYADQGTADIPLWRSEQPQLSIAAGNLLNRGDAITSKMGTKEQVREFWDKFGSKNEDGSQMIIDFDPNQMLD